MLFLLLQIKKKLSDLDDNNAVIADLKNKFSDVYHNTSKLWEKYEEKRLKVRFELTKEKSNLFNVLKHQNLYNFFYCGIIMRAIF